MEFEKPIKSSIKNPIMEMREKASYMERTIADSNKYKNQNRSPR